MKVSSATLSFQGHAMYWWTSLEKERRINHEPPIQYWNKLHNALRRRHIPPYYDRELMDKLQRLKQGRVTRRRAPLPNLFLMKKKKKPLKNKEWEDKVPSLEANVPSKEVVHKSHLSLKNDIKKTLLIEQPLYLLYFKETSCH
uniref:Retrotransposon gag domain-containing protein n=1 Tax=Cajanus cajan TaxID=3821 RepID=A0A151QLB1_CAJCA|nr:hypothetical protein KK1_049059 [Cajanus cajan]